MSTIIYFKHCSFSALVVGLLKEAITKRHRNLLSKIHVGDAKEEVSHCKSALSSFLVHSNEDLQG